MSSDARISKAPALKEETKVNESLAAQVWSPDHLGGMIDTRTKVVPILKDGLVPNLKLIEESQPRPFQLPHIDAPAPRHHRPNVFPSLPDHSGPYDPQNGSNPYGPPNPSYLYDPRQRFNPYERHSPHHNSSPADNYPNFPPPIPVPDRIGNKTDGWWT